MDIIRYDNFEIHPNFREWIMGALNVYTADYKEAAMKQGYAKMSGDRLPYTFDEIEEMRREILRQGIPRFMHRVRGTATRSEWWRVRIEAEGFEGHRDRFAYKYLTTLWKIWYDIGCYYFYYSMVPEMFLYTEQKKVPEQVRGDRRRIMRSEWFKFLKQSKESEQDRRNRTRK